jgi:protein CpxP
MTPNLSNRFACAAVVALLALPTAGFAASSTPASTKPREAAPATAQSSPLAGHPVVGKSVQERVERRIQQLHAQLRITPAEQPQWDKFAQVMRENAREMDQAFLQRAAQFHSMNAVQNMESYEKIAETRAQLLQKLVVSFQELYNALPDQQKQLADQTFRANAEKHSQQAMQPHRARNG